MKELVPILLKLLLSSIFKTILIILIFFLLVLFCLPLIILFSPLIYYKSLKKKTQINSAKKLINIKKDFKNIFESLNKYGI